MPNTLAPIKLAKSWFQPGEKLSLVKNDITGDMYYVSSLYEREIEGQLYLGIFKNENELQRRQVHWMRKDHLKKVKVK